MSYKWVHTIYGLFVPSFYHLPEYFQVSSMLSHVSLFHFFLLANIIFLCIPVTGMIRGISKGFGQSAIAHEMYYQLRTNFTKEALNYLHGEVVAIGLLTQLYYNQTPEHVEKFKNIMIDMNMPVTLNEIGIQSVAELCGYSRMELNENDQRIIIMCGMSAGFSALFGAPMAAAIFSLEVISIGIMHYSALVPCVVASMTAHFLADFL